jgi:hypothetical protein
MTRQLIAPFESPGPFPPPVHEEPLPAMTWFPPRFVYLAGPILGCTMGEANDWRKYVDAKLRPHNIIGISPLRCEPLVGERYTTDYPDPLFGSPRAIAAKNKFDVRTCDVTLALLPLPVPPKTQSYGTLEEIAWADEAGKMTIQITDDPAIIRHPVVDSARGWKLAAGLGHPYATVQEALDAAVTLIVGLLGGYAGGKNV